MQKYEPPDVEPRMLATEILSSAFRDVADCTRPLSVEEVTSALWKGKPGKSMGLDGVSYEFLQSVISSAAWSGTPSKMVPGLTLQRSSHAVRLAGWPDDSGA